MWTRDRVLVAILASLALLAVPAAVWSQAGAGKTLKIYYAGPLTGPRPEVGERMQQGARLAATMVNETGGVQKGPLKGAKIEVVSVDNQYTPEGSSAAGARFLDDPEGFAIICCTSSGNAVAVSSALAPRRIPLLTVFASADFLTDEHQTIWVTPASLAASGYVAASFARTLGPTACVLSGDEGFIGSYLKGVKAGAADTGLSIVQDLRYTPGETEFKALISRCLAAKPAVILTGGSEGEDGPLVNQIRLLGFKGTIIDYRNNMYSRTFLGAAKENAVGVFTVLSTMPSPPAGSLLEKINGRFQAAYGATMTPPAQYGYDAMLTVVCAIETGAQSRADLVTVYPRTSSESCGREGVTGKIGFGANRRPKDRLMPVVKFNSATNLSDVSVIQLFGVDENGKATPKR
jgi:branched-chain amino acid transport system substrate-binding protein